MTGIGHNSGDDFSQLTDRANEFGRAAKEWGANGCRSDEDEQGIADFISEARALYKELDTMRKAEKEPHDAAAKEVQARFKPLLDVVEKAGKIGKTLIGSYFEQKQREEEARAAEARRKAEEDVRKAEEAAADAETRGDHVQAAEMHERAELQAKKAEAEGKAEKVKARTEYGKAISLRTVKEAKVFSVRQAMLFYEKHPDMEALLVRLANADVRSGATDIPGIEITERKVAA